MRSRRSAPSTAPGEPPVNGERNLLHIATILLDTTGPERGTISTVDEGAPEAAFLRFPSGLIAITSRKLRGWICARPAVLNLKEISP